MNETMIFIWLLGYLITIGSAISRLLDDFYDSPSVAFFKVIILLFIWPPILCANLAKD
jgi:hypothetical protein